MNEGRLPPSERPKADGPLSTNEVGKARVNERPLIKGTPAHPTDCNVGGSCQFYPEPKTRQSLSALQYRPGLTNLNAYWSV